MAKNCNFIEKLRELGLRPTKPRVKICEVLFNRDKTNSKSDSTYFEDIEELFKKKSYQ